MDILTDIRHAFRNLFANRGFALTVVLTLALGLAAVSTIFAVVETVMLRPLYFPHSERIFTISQRLLPLGSGPSVASLREFRRWEETGLFECAAAIGTAEYTLLGKDRAQRLFGVAVTTNFFRVFRVQPFLGRGFVTSDATPGRDHVLVLSYALWRSSFGGDPGIVGKSFRMSEGPMTVIGVMPPRFDFPRLADVRTIMFWAPEQNEFWTPLSITEKRIEEGDFNYYVVGRLKDAVTPQRASERFQASAVQMFRDKEVQEPSSRALFERTIGTLAVYVVPLRDTISWSIRDTLWMLLAAVALLLVLVLFNLGNLELTRIVARSREFLVREALGATRWQLFRQRLVEQILLVASAALVSMALSEWGVSAIRTVGAAYLPRIYDLSIDARVSALLATLSLVVALLFGGLPWVVLGNFSAGSLMHGEGRSITADRRTNRFKSGVMVVQIALSMVLLVAAGLLISSFVNVMRVNPGFDVSNLLNITVSLNPKTNQDPATRIAHVREILDAFRSIPGVESAAVVNHVPLTGEVDIHDPQPVGRSSNGWRAGAEYRVVDASYFRTMRIPLLAGREFREGEPAQSAIVNRKLASHLWPGEDALEKQFTDGDGPPFTVVGIVGDIHDGLLESEPRTQFYVPLAAAPWFAQEFMIRTRTEPAGILSAVRQTVWRLDPEAPISHSQIMERLLDSVTLDRRFETWMVVSFAGAALFLAAVGIYSVASLSISRRTREFGIRVALGARAVDLLWLEMRHTLTIVVVGLCCGVTASLPLTKLLAGLLYNVAPWSPTVYGTAIVSLTLPALIAGWVPAQRAANVDPMVALRNE